MTRPQNYFGQHSEGRAQKQGATAIPRKLKKEQSSSSVQLFLLKGEQGGLFLGDVQNYVEGMQREREGAFATMHTEALSEVIKPSLILRHLERK